MSLTVGVTGVTIKLLGTGIAWTRVTTSASLAF